jgi:hypothetical protein
MFGKSACSGITQFFVLLWQKKEKSHLKLVRTSTHHLFLIVMPET